MSNNLSAITLPLIAPVQETLRESAIAPRLVNTDYSSVAVARGTPIQIPIPTATSTTPVVASHEPIEPTDVVANSVNLEVDQWVMSLPFAITDKEFTEVSPGIYPRPMALDEAVRALVNTLDAQVWSNYTGISTFVGAPDRYMFDTGGAGGKDDPNGLEWATFANAQLNRQAASRSEARLSAISLNAEAYGNGLSAFSELQKSGDSGPIQRYELGTKFGIRWTANNTMPTHTVGTAISAYTSNSPTHTVTLISNSAVGDTSVTLKVGSSTATLKKGDLIKFAGDTNIYSVGADVTLNTTGVSVSLNKKLAVALNGSSTPVAVSNPISTWPTAGTMTQYGVNLVFNRSAFALALRALANVSGIGSVQPIFDPVTGITVRLEATRQFKQDTWTVDALWGSVLARGDVAIRVIELVS